MTPYLSDPDCTLYQGDALDVLRALPSGLVDCCVTSPPYLDARPEYGHPDARWWDEFFHVAQSQIRGPMLVNVGRLWRNGIESHWWIDLLGYAKARGWEHLDTLIWIKPNANPIGGRFLTNAHEYVLVIGDPETTELNVDAARTPYPEESIARMGRRWLSSGGVKNTPSTGREGARAPHELGARPRSYITIYTGREKGNEHPAPMALELAEYLVRLAVDVKGLILDPFAGSGTTLLAARKHGRRAIGIELDPQFCAMAKTRLAQLSLLN